MPFELRPQGKLVVALSVPFDDRMGEVPALGSPGSGLGSRSRIMGGVALPVSRRPRLPRELATAIYDGSCVLFLGAGLSRVYAGLPDGRELARRLGWKLLEDPTLTDAKRRYIREELERRDEALDLPSVARYYSQHNPGDPQVSGRARLLTALNKVLDVDLTAQQLDDLAFLVKYPWRAIYTTNYDMVVEYVLDGAHAAYHRITKNDDLLALPWSALKFVKLHGSIDELFHDNDGLRLILTDTDYHFYREGRELLFDELRNDLAKYPFLYLGYGLRDEHFTGLLALLNQLVNLRQRTSYILARPQDVNPFDTEQRASEGLATIAAGLRDFIADLEYAQEQDRLGSDLQEVIDMSWQDRLTFRKQANELARLYFEDCIWGGTNAADLLRRRMEEDFLKGVSLLGAVKPRVSSEKVQDQLDKELQALGGRYVDQFAKVIGARPSAVEPVVVEKWHADCELALRSLPLIWNQLDTMHRTGSDPVSSRRTKTAQLLTRFLLDCDDSALVHIASRSITDCLSRYGSFQELVTTIETVLIKLDEPYAAWRHSSGGAADAEILELTLCDERRPVVNALKALVEPVHDLSAISEDARLRHGFSPATYANPHVHWELLALGLAESEPPSIDLLSTEPQRFLLHAVAFLRAPSRQGPTAWLDDLGPGGFNDVLRRLVSEDQLAHGGLFERRAIALLAVAGTATGMQYDPDDFLDSIGRYLTFLERTHLDGPAYPILTVPALVESILRFGIPGQRGIREVALYRRLLNLVVAMDNPLLWQAALRRLTQLLPQVARHDPTVIRVLIAPLQTLVLRSEGIEPDPWLKYRAMNLLGELWDEPPIDGEDWQALLDWIRNVLTQSQFRPLHRVVQRRLLAGRQMTPVPLADG